MPLSRAQFESFYNERRLEIYRYILSLQLPAADAQELTQEAFLRLFQEIESGGSGAVDHPRAWLFRVAHNLAIDVHRRYEAQGAESPTSAYATARDRGDIPEIAVLGKERTRLLMEAIASLSKQQRACLHLRAEGLRYREIAEVLGVSTPTVGEFLQRAIKRMRAAIYG
jgi:RNA polymerase sigma-70 factor (ECF subfamily)